MCPLRTLFLLEMSMARSSSLTGWKWMNMFENSLVGGQATHRERAVIGRWFSDMSAHTLCPASLTGIRLMKMFEYSLVG